MIHTPTLRATCICGLTLVLLSCGGGGGGGGGQEQVGAYSGPVSIQLTVPQVVSYDPATGKTTVTLQFIPRGNGNTPLEESQVVAELSLNNQPLDVESVLNPNAEELAINIHFGMLLDTSFSMTTHNPPAFHPMLAAARKSLSDGIALWNSRPGSFRWALMWFDEQLRHALHNSPHWSLDDILKIDEPTSGTTTRLFQGAQYASWFMNPQCPEPAKMPVGCLNSTLGDNDHYVLIVFSDGADNQSWHDNRPFVTPETLSTSADANYFQFGWDSTDLNDVVGAISAHPRLTVHVLGLGTAVDDAELSAIANAGNGRYLKNPDPGSVASLFSEITKEFTTILSRGATMPLQPGNYSFTLTLWNSARTQSDTYTFNFVGGQ